MPRSRSSRSGGWPPSSGAWSTPDCPRELLYLEDAARALRVGLGAFVAAFALVHGWRWIRAGWVLETRTRGALCSVGILPGARRWRRRPVKLAAKRWPRACAWQASADPDMAAAFRAILDTLGGDPTLAASPVKGAHGDATLLEHSLHVVETGLELLAQGWTYDQRPKDPLHGSALPADAHPLAALILLAHDLGKLDAFRAGGASKPSHDREGARILATLEPLWRLPEDDRKTLIAVVAHEHHPQDLPVHTGDQARLLLEFLIAADTLASQREEGKRPASAAVSDTDTASETPDHDALWAWFIDFLVKPNSINGRDKRFRVGFKGSDERFYLNEVSIRRVLAEAFYHDPAQAEVRLGDGRYRLTESLLEMLGARGVLVCEHQGKHFTPKSALFKVVSRSPKGNVLAQWSAALVLDLGALTPPRLRALAPAPNAPEIVEAVFGQRALKTPPVTAPPAAPDTDTPDTGQPVAPVADPTVDPPGPSDALDVATARWREETALWETPADAPPSSPAREEAPDDLSPSPAEIASAPAAARADTGQANAVSARLPQSRRPPANAASTRRRDAPSAAASWAETAVAAAHQEAHAKLVAMGQELAGFLQWLFGVEGDDLTTRLANAQEALQTRLGPKARERLWQLATLAQAPAMAASLEELIALQAAGEAFLRKLASPNVDWLGQCLLIGANRADDRAAIQAQIAATGGLDLPLEQAGAYAVAGGAALNGMTFEGFVQALTGPPPSPLLRGLELVREARGHLARVRLSGLGAQQNA